MAAGGLLPLRLCVTINRGPRSQRPNGLSGPYVSILLKIESIDENILSDTKAKRRLFNQIALWVDEQLAMRGAIRPSYTVIEVTRGHSNVIVAARDGNTPWWFPTGKGSLSEEDRRHPEATAQPSAETAQPSEETAQPLRFRPAPSKSAKLEQSFTLEDHLAYLKCWCELGDPIGPDPHC